MKIPYLSIKSGKKYNSRRRHMEDAFLIDFGLKRVTAHRRFWRWLTFQDLEECAQQRLAALKKRTIELERECELVFNGIFLLPGYWRYEEKWYRDGGTKTYVRPLPIDKQKGNYLVTAENEPWYNWPETYFESGSVA